MCCREKGERKGKIKTDSQVSNLSSRVDGGPNYRDRKDWVAAGRMQGFSFKYVKFEIRQWRCQVSQWDINLELRIYVKLYVYVCVYIYRNIYIHTHIHMIC